MRHNQLVALAEIVQFRQHLKVPVDVKPAHDATPQRNNVIHFVSDTGLSRQSCGLNVDGPNGCHIGPSWRSREFHSLSLGDQRIDASWIGLAPALVICAKTFGVGQSPLGTASEAVFSVLPIPFFERRRVFHLPLFRAFDNARDTCTRESIRGSASNVEVAPRFNGVADIASLQPSRFHLFAALSLFAQCRLANIRATFLADIIDSKGTARASFASDSTSPSELIAVLINMAVIASLRCWFWRPRRFMSRAIGRCVGATFLRIAFPVGLARGSMPDAPLLWGHSPDVITWRYCFGV